jgi:polo-like kinase 1
MLTGHPPFETARTKLTYEYIKTCQYKFPSHIKLSQAAMDFVKCILQLKPESRPSAQDLAMHPFLTAELGPRLPDRGISQRKPEVKKLVISAPREENVPVITKAVTQETVIVPGQFVARFCDHSDKYGLGYMLIDGTIGACFNDLTRMAMDPHEKFVQYWENYQTADPEVMNLENENEGMQKKLSLIRRFSESLKKTRSMYELPERRYSETVPLHHVKYWMRNDEATLFRMEDRNIQVNFNDRVKIVIFWNTKTMTMVRNIREAGRLLPLADVSAIGGLVDERRRFNIAKEMLTEMSGR